MAKLLLSDGRQVPLKAATLRDGITAELALRKAEKLSAADYREISQSGQYQTALSLFATLRAAGEDVDFVELLALDMNELGGMLHMEPGDEPDTEEAEAMDPPRARTGGSVGSAKKSPRK